MSRDPRHLRKQNQHELPEFYLAAFCDPRDRGHLWAFTRQERYWPSKQRRKGNPFRSGIHQTAARRNRYAGRLLDGTFEVERWEQELQRREHAVDDLIIRARSKGSFSDSDKELFADYLLTMWLRVSKRWEETERRAREHVRKADVDQLARTLAYTGRIGDARRIYEAKAFLNSEAGIKYLLLESMLQKMELCRGALLSMTWNFVSSAPGTFFVTSDVPFMFDENLGLRASHVRFPISPDIMLVAGHGDAVMTPYGSVSPEEMLKLNSLTLASAHREVYAPSSAEWIYNMWRYGVTFDSSGGRINVASTSI